MMDERDVLLQDHVLHGDVQSFSAQRKTSNNIQVSLLQRLTMAKQVAVSLEARHSSCGISHGDLDANSVVGYDFEGDSVEALTMEICLPTPVVSLAAADVRRFANFLLALWKGCGPLCANEVHENSTVTHKNNSKPIGMPDGVWEVVNMCHALDFRKRPTFRTIVANLEAEIKLAERAHHLETIPWFAPGFAWRQDDFELSAKLDEGLAWQVLAEGVMIADLASGDKLARDLALAVTRRFEEGGRAGSRSSHKIKRLELVKNIGLLAKFNSSLRHLHERRVKNGALFTQALPASDAEKMARLAELQHHFAAGEWGHSHDTEGAHVLLAWHGCGAAAADAIVLHGMADVLRSTDGGWFGAGANLAIEEDYAAMFSTGAIYGPVPGKEHVMLLCAAVVAQTYPVTRGTDYIQSADNMHDISVFHSAYPAKTEEDLKKRHDKALKRGFDSHFVAIKVERQYQVCWWEEDVWVVGRL